MAEPIPYIEPFSPAPNRQTDSREQFTIKVDQRMLEENRFTGQANALADFVNARAQGVGESVSAAQQSAAAAQQAEQAAGQQVALAADEVAKAAQKVEAATEQADRATEQASAAQSYAAAAGAAAGLPALAGKAGMFMQVTPDEQGVRWVEVKPQRIGDILMSARGSVEGYLEAVGGIYLQAAYPELYAELGLLGGDAGLSWTLPSNFPAPGTPVGMAIGNDGTILVLCNSSMTNNVARSTDGGQTWQVTQLSVSGQTSCLETNGEGVWVFMSYVSSNSACYPVVSTDNGATWTVKQAFAGSASGRAKFLKHSNGTWVVGGHANALIRTRTPEAAGWGQSIAMPLTMVSVTSNGNGVWLIVGSGTTSSDTRISTDDGLTWTSIGSTVGTVGKSSLSVETDQKGTWIITGADFCIRSIDDRLTWQTFQGTFAPTSGQLVTDREGVWLVVGSTNTARRSIDAGQTWRPLSIPTSSGYAIGGATQKNGEFYIAYSITGGSGGVTGIGKSIPAYGYDTATQFRLPNVPAPSGLKSFIKAKEIAA